jgi:hypothetical protein
MLLGWPSTMLLLIHESAQVENATTDAYTKPMLISPHTAAFVDSAILTFHTT